MAIHGLVFTVCQVQPFAEVTPTRPVRLNEDTVTFETESAYWHVTPAWTSVKTWPATITVPVRATKSGFAVTA